MHANLLFSVGLGAKPCEIKCVFFLSKVTKAQASLIYGPPGCRGRCFSARSDRSGHGNQCRICANARWEQTRRRTEETSHTTPAMGPQRPGAPGHTRERSRPHLRSIWSLFWIQPDTLTRVGGNRKRREVTPRGWLRAVCKGITEGSAGYLGCLL